MKQYIAKVRNNGVLTLTTREGLVNTFSWCNAVMNTKSEAVVYDSDGKLIARYDNQKREWKFEH